MQIKNGNYNISLDLLPSKTNSNVKKMLETENIDKANKLADEILNKNKYISIAYDVKSKYCLENKDYKKMISYKKQEINLNKYNIEEYEDLVLMISQALEKSIKENDSENINYLLKELKSVYELLEETKKITNPLAYKINDKPEFDMDESIKNYIQKMDKIYKETM